MDLSPPGSATRARWLPSLWQDFRHVGRALRAARGFTLVAVATLALSTASLTVMLSVTNWLFLRPVPGVGAPRELAALEVWNPRDQGGRSPAPLPSEATAAAMRRLAARVDPAVPLFSVRPLDALIAQDRLPLRALAWALGLLAAFGLLVPITLDGRALTVIGVMPPDFDGPRIARADAWAPVNQGSLPGATGCRAAGVEVYARIRSDLTLGTAQARLQAITRGARSLTSLDDANLGTDRTMLLTLLGAVSCVLLIACANVANLLLERAVRRRREIATRLALGASPGRLVRQMLTESVLLSTMGTLGGLVAARFVLGALVALLPGGLPHVNRVALNLRVLLVVVAAGVVAGLVAGVVPAVQASSRGLATWLHDARAVTSPSRSWTRRVLVVVEVALSVALLVGALLTARSFLTLRPTHPGFDPSNKIVAGTRLQGARYQSPQSRLAFLDDWRDRLGRVPGVRGVSLVNFAPFSGLTTTRRVTVQGRPDTDDGRGSVETSIVTPNYFDELGIPVKRGRGFLPTDDARAMPVAIVSEALARSVWPDGDPMGGVITAKTRTGDAPPRVVVGVVSDIRTFGGSTRPTPQLYLPMAQEPPVSVNAIVRTAGGPMGDLPSVIRREAAAVDPTQVVDPVTSLDDIIARSQGGRRFVTWLMCAFAVMAMGLAIVGLTAVIGASVAQRTREIGIRMTLGARPGSVIRLVLGQVLILAGSGVVIGLGLAAATTRLLANSLYGVTPLDGPTFAASAALMVLAAAAAGYLPARRATAVDPLVALRAE